MGGNNSSVLLYLFSYLFSHLAKHLTRNFFLSISCFISACGKLRRSSWSFMRENVSNVSDTYCVNTFLCLSKPGLRRSMQIISQDAERTLICWLQCRLPQICKYRFVMLCFTACFRGSVPTRLPNKHYCSLSYKHWEIKINFVSPQTITEAWMIG